MWHSQIWCVETTELLEPLATGVPSSRVTDYEEVIPVNPNTQLLPVCRQHVQSLAFCFPQPRFLPARTLVRLADLVGFGSLDHEKMWTPEVDSVAGKLSAELIHKHNVAVFLVDLGVEKPAAVRRHGEASGETFFQMKDFADLLGCEIKVTQGFRCIRR